MFRKISAFEWAQAPFDQQCIDQTMSPDSFGYPFLPDGTVSIRFSSLSNTQQPQSKKYVISFEAGMTTKDAGVFSIRKELMVKFEENVVQSSSVDPINAHVSVATEFMNRILVERQVCGILTDATYRKYFCKVDLSNGFWNVPITPESQEILAFEIPGLGQYTWKVLPQGLKISPSAFQNQMESILSPLSPLDIHPYMDDMIYGADTIKELDRKTSMLLTLLEHHRMKINKDKCVFNALSIEALGFEISQGSIKPKESYLSKLSETPTPTNVQRLRKFIGKFNHVREHFPGSEKSLRALYPLLQKTSRFRWTSQHAEAFEHLKWLLDTPQKTSDFDRGKELTMISDAGEDGFAVQLKQGSKLIATIARKYNPKSIAFLSPPIREAHAIKESLLAFRTQIIGSHVHCLTDSLVAFHSSSRLSRDRML